MEALDQQIDSQRNSIRTDKLDMTYGELASLYEAGELVISPDYQRLFRWSEVQKARFVESVLLGFPIPAIFVAETDQGIWELVDGLQRLSTIFEFMGVLRSPEGQPLPPSVIDFSGTQARLSLLNGLRFEDLSLRSRLAIKRASCRVEVIKVGSAPRMKYEVFERLNTGGSGLTHQEVRNCVFRAIDPDFMRWVDDLARFPQFAQHLGLSEAQMMSMYDRGLILRFLALKTSFEHFLHDVEPFITEYTRKVIEREIPFDRQEEERVFRSTFGRIAEALGDDAWRHFRDGEHKGPFSVYVFDALSVGVARNISVVEGMGQAQLRERLLRVKQAPAFLQNTGAGANIRSKFLARLNAAIAIIGGADGNV